MPTTRSYADGQSFANVSISDDFGTMTITGAMIRTNGPSPIILSQTVTLPAIPSTGMLYVSIQVDNDTGTASVYQSTSSPPAAQSNASGTGTQRVFGRIVCKDGGILGASSFGAHANIGSVVQASFEAGAATA